MHTYIHLCTSYIDDFTTIPYIGDYSMAYILFCTTERPHDGPLRPETWSFIKLRGDNSMVYRLFPTTALLDDRPV
jgi:hypothetical protein